MTIFTRESDFEEALINILINKGWESCILKNSTEEQLKRNWAEILFDNNKEMDRLNGQPLTTGEMDQIIEQINRLRTPLRLNGFINGKTVSIIRDNPKDTLHYRKEISLKIYDRHEIAAGQSRYQIVQQPDFPTKSPILNNRRGDLMLLINGMPVIHLELKRSGVSVRQAANQIEKYSKEGVFSGLFSLVQIFVAMEPEETLYFANPGTNGVFNSNYYFHWADFNNELINDWKSIASGLLSIPMAHQLIGFYTVADDTDGILKVMRSYQYYAANAISDKTSKIKWNEARNKQLGGYIWHTTGSGKTMTSFKSAQLIANSKDADKVIFLMDRIELGTQSLQEYRGFADDADSVQATEDGTVLRTKLKSDSPSDVLIVTSIQKMSLIKEDGNLNTKDLENMRGKRIVFIVDEAHRSTFGDMLLTIKNTFTEAILFGFTGTPIKDENEKKKNTTSTIFGDELHRYTIADGIRDKNVLGFDPTRVATFRDKDLRREVGLSQAKAKNEQEAFDDEAKKKVYLKFTEPGSKVRMAGFLDKTGKYHKGIEDYLSNTQYSGGDALYDDKNQLLEPSPHQQTVVNDILNNWMTLSQNGMFHAIFTTDSIKEAIKYYRLFKKNRPELKVTALFDPNIDNNGGAGVQYKEDGLVEIMEDYNQRYNQNYTIASHSKFKKDLASRLAHKDVYKYIHKEPQKQIDLLIVVDQMLTGFDSKWINTLYVDKKMEYERIIQAFSRTNRLFGPEKPFGTIRYYRRPYTMERNIEDAVKLYSGDKPIDLFVDKLEDNLKTLNRLFMEIKEVFSSSGIKNFEKLPDEIEAKAKFAKLFKEFNDYLDAATIQGFKWSKSEYEFGHGSGRPKTKVKMKLDEQTYLILLLRYKELSSNDGEKREKDVPFDLYGHITEHDTGLIDSDYMNNRFSKYLRALEFGHAEEALNELHKTFASLTQEEQRYANIFIHDIQRGDIEVDMNKSFRDYITEYQAKGKRNQIKIVVSALGLDEEKLQKMMFLNITEMNIDEFGRFSELKNTVDKTRAREYFEAIEGKKIKPFQVNAKVDKLLRKFIFEDGFDLPKP